MLALFVTFTIRPETRDRFLAGIAEQAATSLELEPGCRQFDVCVDVEDPNRFLLYEVYADEEAFRLHRTTPHFARWTDVKAECVLEQQATVAEIV